MTARTLRGLAIAAGLSVSTVALAGPIYSINAAMSDSYGPNSGGHALWFPDSANSVPNGNSPTFLFVDDSGVLEFNNDLTEARMTGQIMSVSDPASVWEVDFSFILGMSHTEFTDGAGHANPEGGTSFGQAKRELNSNAYANNGGPVDPSTWRFFDIDEGSSTLTGIGGAIDGVTLDITQRPGGADYGKFVFQVGVGANGKNINYGASTWFDYSGQFSGRGDINIDLKEIPTPGAAVIAMLAVGLTGARRRR